MSPSKATLIATAKQCIRLGLLPLPTNGDKRPVIKWSEFDSSAPTTAELLAGYAYSFTAGISVQCGRVSGNLEVIDVDVKNDIEGNLMAKFFGSIRKADSTLAGKLVIARTRSGGYHLFYKCDTVDKTMPLAQRPPTAEELLKHPKLKVKVLIETRSNGANACIAPTEGYAFLRGGLSSIPIITPEERNTILTCAKALNKYMEPEEKPVKKPAKKPRQITSFDTTESPIDDYNNKAQPDDVVALLVKHGWTVVDDRKPNITHLKRPGDSDKYSSGNYNHTLKLFSTFSTSTEFKDHKGYSPAGVFIMLECNNNRTEGVKRLLADGYGKSYQQQRAEAHLSTRIK